MTKHCTLVVLLLTVLAVFTESIAGEEPTPQFAKRHWTVTEGLPTNNLLSLCQTRDGFLWLGTEDGLARFDGSNFHVLSRANSKIPHNTVYALTEDGRGTLWVGTRGGLASFRNGVFETYRTTRGKPNNAIYDLAFEAPDTLWIGTEEGLNAFDIPARTFRTFTVDEGLPDNLVSKLLIDREDRLWAATPKGVAQKTGENRFRIFTVADGLLSNRILAMQDSDEGLFMGTTSGLSRFRNDRFEQVQPETTGIICSLLLDKNKRLWVGYTSQKPLIYLTFGNTNEKRSESIGEINGVMASLQDREKNLWFATYGSGLFSLTPARIETLGLQKSQAPSEILSVYESATRGLLVSDSKSVYQLKNGEAHKIVDVANATALTDDPQGRLVVGTILNGLKVQSENGWKDLGVRDGLPTNVIHSLLTARDGRVWIGTAMGPAVLYPDGRIQSLAQLLPGRILAMAEDPAQGLWLGAEARGLALFQNGSLRIFEEKDGFLAETVVSLYAEPNGTVWVGTDGGGLYRYRKGVFQHYGVQDGLYHDRILQILDDRRGHLWMGTNKGIFRVRKSDLNDFAQQKIHSFVSAHYDETDGMLSSEITAYLQPGAWRLQNETLCFATFRGIAVVRPEFLVGNPLPPPGVFIESVTGAGEAINPEAPIILPAGRGDINVHLGGFTFGASNQIYFRHKMENQDKDWIPAQERLVSYKNLPHGSYKLLIQARSKDGDWAAESLEIPITVKPFFYERKSFYAVSALALFCFTAILLSLRTRRLVRQNELLEAKIRERTSALQETARETAVLEERNRIAQELHDSLAQSLTAIVLQIQTALSRMYSQDEDVRELLQTAKRTARESLEETRRSVQALHPLLLERTDFQHAVREITRKMSLGTTIEVSCEFTGDPIVLTKHTEMNLLRIIQEGLSNAIRHSKAAHIEIRISYAANQVELSIKDDGVGFQHSINPEENFGLSNIRHRADTIGAVLVLDSSPGTGTTVQCTLPLSNRPDHVS